MGCGNRNRTPDKQLSLDQVQESKNPQHNDSSSSRATFHHCLCDRDYLLYIPIHHNSLIYSLFCYLTCSSTTLKLHFRLSILVWQVFSKCDILRTFNYVFHTISLFISNKLPYAFISIWPLYQLKHVDLHYHL